MSEMPSHLILDKSSVAAVSAVLSSALIRKKTTQTQKRRLQML